MSEYNDSHMLSSILERMAAQAMHLKEKIDAGLEIPSWAEYKLYSAYDAVGKALGTAYPGEYVEEDEEDEEDEMEDDEKMAAAFTPALDRHPALKGGQSRLPDKIQAEVIKKKLRMQKQAADLRFYSDNGRLYHDIGNGVMFSLPEGKDAEEYKKLVEKEHGFVGSTAPTSKNEPLSIRMGKAVSRIMDANNPNRPRYRSLKDFILRRPDPNYRPGAEVRSLRKEASIPLIALGTAGAGLLAANVYGDINAAKRLRSGGLNAVANPTKMAAVFTSVLDRHPVLKKLASRPIKHFKGQLNKDRWWFLSSKGNPTHPKRFKDRPADAAPAEGDIYRPWNRAESHLHGPKGGEGIHFKGTLAQARAELKRAKAGNSILKVGSQHTQLSKEASATATKTDPQKWEDAKAEAKAKMGGKHSARAMQLATQIYKKDGGGYSGAKPTSSNNSLKKWTKQDWNWTGGDKPGPGGRGVYLPENKADRLRETEEGKQELAAAARKKSEATRKGEQYSSHGLAANTSLRSKK